MNHKERLLIAVDFLLCSSGLPVAFNAQWASSAGQTWFPHWRCREQEIWSSPFAGTHRRDIFQTFFWKWSPQKMKLTSNVFVWSANWQLHKYDTVRESCAHWGHVIWAPPWFTPNINMDSSRLFSSLFRDVFPPPTPLLQFLVIFSTK